MTLKSSVSDAPSCGVTYDRHSDNSSGCHLCSKRKFIVQASLMTIVIYDCHIFIVQATG